MARARTRAMPCSCHYSRRAARVRLRVRARCCPRDWRRDDFEEEKVERNFRYKFVRAIGMAMFSLVLLVIHGSAQTTGSTSLSGVVADPSGAVVPGATVEIHNPVSEFNRSTTTDSAGRFSFSNVPFNPYHLSVTITGFAAYSQDVDVHSAVPQNLKITLQIAGSAENVTVQGEAGDLLENDPTFHTDVDRSLFDKLPWKALPHSSVRWSHWPRQAWRRIPMDSFTAWETMRLTRSLWMANRSPINRAKYFPTRFRSTPCNR